MIGKRALTSHAAPDIFQRSMLSKGSDPVTGPVMRVVRIAWSGGGELELESELELEKTVINFLKAETLRVPHLPH